VSDDKITASQLGGSGNIVGVTFNDLNGDGIFDQGSLERVIGGVTVYLDQNNNGTLDPGELSSVSRPDGVYSFLGLVDGEYFLRQIPPTGTVSTRLEPVAVNISNGAMVREPNLAFGSTIGDIIPPPPSLGSISGVKYNDFNRDGLRDPAEPGLPGFTIYIDQNNNGLLDPGELTDVSAEDGSFGFINLPLNATYTIREVPQPGFVQTTPDPISVSLSPEQPNFSDVLFGNATIGPGTGEISGVLFEDLNINGVRDFNEPVIPGGEVFLDQNRNGILDEGEIISVTDQFGFYSFIGITPGLFNVDVIRNLDEARTTPNPVIIFTGTEEIPSVVVDIGLITPGGTGNVQGVKYLDANANRMLDPDEPGIPNFTIYADLNSNNILDVDEPFDITDTNGVYFLPNLPATRLTIREAEQQLGFNLVPPQSQTVDVRSGETLLGVNFGNAEINTIAGVVFIDNNSNGVIEPGDIGLSNSTVYLDLNENGIFDPDEPFRVTSDRGQYNFNTLPPDTYVVRVVPQPGFTQTTPDPVIVVTSGEDANFINIGQAPATPLLQGDLIGNKFNDFNSNGVLDPGEPGLPNFTLYLDLNGNNILDPNEPASISNVAGDFSFNNPPVGTYFLREIPQAGFVQTTPDQQITILEPINVLQGDPPIVLNVGNAVIPPVAPAGPEGPEAAPTPTPVTDADAGTTDVTTDADAGTTDATTDADAGTTDATTDADAGTTDATTDADAGTTDATTDADAETTDATTDADVGGQATQDGILTASQVTGTGRITGTKFNDINGNNVIDPDEPGLPGFTIYLDLNDNKVLDAGEPESITNAEGGYSFQNLPAGTYPVKVVEQPNFIQTTPDPIINLAEGSNVDFVNIGSQAFDVTIPVIPPIETNASGTITGVKFDDRNADGLAGPDEPRLIDVEIFVDLNGNGFAEANEPVTRTDAHGEYRFILPPGNYRVLETPPAGFVNTTPTPLVPVVPGQTVVFNFGDTSIFDPNTVISGVIFTDSNNNGVQDSGEAGIPTAQVFLDLDNDGLLEENEDLNGNGVLDEGEDTDNDGILDLDEPETFTDPNGRYTFNGVLPGSYTVDVVLQENLFLTATPPTVNVTIGDVTIAPPINLPFGGSLTNVDVGVNVTSPEGDTVSGIVFADNNGNGLFEPLEGEVGLPGVEVFLDTHTDGQIQGFEPNQISGPGGTYGLDTSGISGTFPLLQILDRTGFTQTTPPAVVTVGGGSSIVYNFGNQRQTLITGTVFEDFNSNGIQDFSDTNGNGVLDPDEFVERGVPGFQIYVDLNENGVLDNQDIEPNTFTDTNGDYAIVGLLPGTYTLRLIPREVITDPNDPAAVSQGFIPTTPTDLTITIDQFENSDVVIDFGQSPVLPPAGRANISGIAYIDDNGNGMPDPGELQLADATIYIDANENGERDDGERFAVTDQFGRYDIPNIDPGTYVVRQEAFPGFTDSTTETPVIVTLTAGDNINVNFADNPTNLPKAVLPVVDLGGIVFNDVNGNGQIDPGDNGIPGVTVFLDRNGNLILDNEEREAITDSLGVYDFNNLPPGTYTVRQVPPPGLFQTTPDPTVTLFAGDDANFVNFGNSTNLQPVPPIAPPVGTGSVSGVTFEDLNGSGLLDPGEPTIAGVVVYFDQNNNSVRDADEIFVASDANGNYGFFNLADASYTVRQELNPDQAAIFSQTTPDPLVVNTFGAVNITDINIGSIRI